MNSTEDLFPCAHCPTGNGFLIHFPTTDTYEAGCTDCGIRTGMCLSRQEAVNKWNRREGSETAMRGQHYIIQRRATESSDDWLKLRGTYATVEEAREAFSEKFHSDYERANHRIMEAYQVTRYREVKR